ncbi:MAG: DUF835 domain-containing protein [Candidatus Thermoplasmatota archaeon]
MEQVEIKHPFDLVFRIEKCPISDKLQICNAFDSYEVLRGVEDVFVVDVLEINENQLLLRISLKEPVTYKEISEYINDMLNFVKEKTKLHGMIEPIGIKWFIKDFGSISEKFEEKRLADNSKRKELLSKIGIELLKEDLKKTERKYDLPPNKYIYLINEKKLDRSIEIFTDAVLHGTHGLCITRTHPSIIRESYGLKKTPIIWLSQTIDKNEKTVLSTDIPNLHLIITDFIERAGESIVFLDGLEYLITNNNFQTVLKFLHLLNDKVMLHPTRVIIPFDSSTVDEKQYALLEKETKKLEISLELV